MQYVGYNLPFILNGLGRDQCHKGYYKEITEPTGDEEPGFLLKTMTKAAAKLKGVKA